MNTIVKKALDHIQTIHPTVDRVSYDKEGGWLYTDKIGEAPSFQNDSIDIALLELAADAAYLDKGFPCDYIKGN